MSDKQLADLRFPIFAMHNGKAPLSIRIVTSNPVYTETGGMPVEKVEDYILFSTLPADLQERVRTAIALQRQGY